ncbi:heme ABC exporter ATP-binding protein CcmA [Pseudomarimonas arenosa]|uniref:Heme ABC exporter ATP-binding protein CcmA n=1 Tax=Pseudomarimonas arenosa TaxID=2774145 RepID=A0AAW3ZGT1_9GAMM|nr:heme ABC exporter ATP-binding protein CcmA [Pseudomarimonas arenosa]MBD8525330.1 heme ABC exporter ATP-binding protein CcmA [Pseudomarimonas arenosa]
MPDSAPLLLRAHALEFARNEERLFGPLELHVAGGEALLIEGHNGCGKTTLLRVLAGLLGGAHGEICMAPQAEVGPVLFLGHLLGLKGELSVEENLQYAMHLQGCRAGTDVEACLAEVGLQGLEDQPARTLSAGQRKRLGLARMRLLPSRLWLLDEPFANLDLEGIALVNRLVERHLAEGGGALITSHGAYATGAYQTRVLRLGRLQ